MKYFIKKTYLAITFLLMASIGYAYDNSTADCYSCPPVSCGKGFISADLLYWRAFESGLDVCVPKEVGDTANTEGKVFSKFRGRSKEPDFTWDPGFRLGIGYGVDGLDFAAFWTHLHSNAHGSKHHGHQVRWNLDLDVLDIIAGYKFDLGSCFALRPFGGIRWARIEQKLHIDDSHCSSSSSQSSTSSALVNDLFTSNIHNNQRFSGAGPLLGLEGDWNIGCGFSLYASGSVSWLYGKFDIRLSEFEEFADGENCCKVKKNLETNLAAADAALGLRWKTCLCADIQLVLQLGLEHHRYFDYNRIGDCCGDLSFDGVSFSAGIEF